MHSLYPVKPRGSVTKYIMQHDSQRMLFTQHVRASVRRYPVSIRNKWTSVVGLITALTDYRDSMHPRSTVNDQK